MASAAFNSRYFFNAREWPFAPEPSNPPSRQSSTALPNVFNPDSVVLTGSSSVFPKELVQGWFDLIAQLTNPQAAADVTFSASTFGHSVWTRGAVLIALERLRPNPHPVVQALIPRVAG